MVQAGVDQPNWDGSGVWVYDTDVAQMVRDVGDSGAPVVVKETGPFGGTGNSAVFSAMWNIEQDLGGMGTLALPRLG